MGAISQLSSSDTIDASTLFAVSINAQDRSVTNAILTAYLQTLIPSSGVKTTQYAAPSATAFSVQITDASDSIWLVLTPTAGFATGTIVLPALANTTDKQEVLVNCTQAVTTLTVDGNGATVTGEPAALTANQSFTLRFDAASAVWYAVG
ncbi:MAG: hypothetical protein ABUJ92_00510 [Desulfobacterales bacterium]